ncbi:MAG: response regulator, partial [Betaproteobacteria bacterium]|nr:response regulator [Betaproteobacteria bacterium]
MPERPLQKICYVEDDDDIQRIARLALERVGKMQVSIIGDPTVAIDGILAFQPDLVLLDWMMPVMDGPTLFKRMRETAGLEDIPVVFITAKASQR